MEYGMAAQTTHCAMGTIMTHKAFGPNAKECLNAVCQEVVRLERLFSRFLPESEISRVNRSAGIRSIKVSPETYTILSQATEYARSLPGCFDVTVQPLVALWQAARESLAQPDPASIEQTLPLVNYRDLLLDPVETTAGLKYSGQSVDLGGIGKGLAGDRILDVYRKYGVTSAYSNLGGNVVTLGVKPDASPWYIGIQHPRREKDLIGVVSVINQTVVTSGDYQRTYTDNQGKQRHHILDPLTGFPAESGLVSVTIVAENSLSADVLSTAIFIAGLEKGIEFLKAIPQTQAILVDADLNVYLTRGLRDRFQAENGILVVCPR